MKPWWNHGYGWVTMVVGLGFDAGFFFFFFNLNFGFWFQWDFVGQRVVGMVVLGLWLVSCHGGCYVVVTGFFDNFFNGLWLGLWVGICSVCGGFGVTMVAMWR